MNLEEACVLRQQFALEVELQIDICAIVFPDQIVQVEGIKYIFVGNVVNRVRSAILAGPTLLLLFRGVFLWFQSIKSWLGLSWALFNSNGRRLLFVCHLNINLSCRLLRRICGDTRALAFNFRNLGWFSKLSFDMLILGFALLCLGLSLTP